MSAFVRLVVLAAVVLSLHSGAAAGILLPGGILTYEQDATDGYLRRYTFDGTLTDQLEVNLAGMPSELSGVWSMTVVGSRVIIAENSIWGRSIGEIDVATGNLTYLFDHQGFQSNRQYNLAARGSELLIHSTLGGSSGVTQGYDLQGNVLNSYVLPAGSEFDKYRTAAGMAYANGELYYAAPFSSSRSNDVGVFDISGSPVMPLLREVPAIGGNVQISVNAVNGDIWINADGTRGLRRVDSEGQSLGAFSTVDGLRDFHVLSYSATAVPEPGSLSLFAVATACGCLAGRRRRTSGVPADSRDDG